MEVDEAIKTAIEYENKVRDVYAQAVERSTDPKARRVFETLADEEKGHVQFLEHCLDMCLEDGVIEPGELTTVVPSATRIEKGVERLRGKLGAGTLEGEEVEMLRRALEVEVETSSFYERMVKVVPEQHRGLFARFLEIEEGHKAIVQAEIDTVTGLGYWFDFQEFDLEAG
jgi:rubrerythrin